MKFLLAYWHHTKTQRHHKAGMRIRSLYSAFKAAAEQAKLPPDFVQHDLRHRRVTAWMAEGKDPVHVKEAVGHADLRTQSVVLRGPTSPNPHKQPILASRPRSPPASPPPWPTAWACGSTMWQCSTDIPLAGRLQYQTRYSGWRKTNSHPVRLYLDHVEESIND